MPFLYLPIYFGRRGGGGSVSNEDDWQSMDFFIELFFINYLQKKPTICGDGIPHTIISYFAKVISCSQLVTALKYKFWYKVYIACILIILLLHIKNQCISNPWHVRKHRIKVHSSLNKMYKKNVIIFIPISYRYTQDSYDVIHVINLYTFRLSIISQCKETPLVYIR